MNFNKLIYKTLIFNKKMNIVFKLLNNLKNIFLIKHLNFEFSLIIK
jgi:hypothetical protein